MATKRKTKKLGKMPKKVGGVGAKRKKKKAAPKTAKVSPSASIKDEGSTLALPKKPLERRTRKLTAEEIGLVNNPDQKLVTIQEDSLPLDLPVWQSEFKVRSKREITLNAKKAAEYIDLPMYDVEREAGDIHVRKLMDIELAGEFNWHNVDLASAWLDDVLWKINGQHTAWMVVFLDHEHEPGFSRRVTETIYEADDAEELARIYNSYDTNKPRDSGHQTQVGLVLADLVGDVPRHKIKPTANGFMFWTFESEKERARVTQGQRTELVRPQQQLFEKVGVFAAEAWKESKYMGRVPVIAAMFETFSKAPVKAAEFWYSVATGLHLKKKLDARYQLKRDLEKRYVRGSVDRASSDPKKNASPEEMYRLCLVAWNRWRKDEEVRVLRWTKTRIRAI